MEKPVSKVAFLSDVHGNSPALEAVLQDIDSYDVNELVMLGDLIPGVDPAGCVALVRNWAEKTDGKLTCIQGNSEAWVLTPDRNTLWEYGIEFLIPPLVDIVDWWEDRLSQEEIDWLRSFPATLRWRNSLLVHDSPLDRMSVKTESNPIIKPEHREWFFHGRGINDDFSDGEFAQQFEWMRQNDYERIFCGHTHNAFIRERNGKIICNAGSAGAPVDGDWRPSWVLLEEGNPGEKQLTIHRVGYELSRIFHLFDENQDYPHFQVRDGMLDDFKSWYATGHHW
ncbi:MAG: metallophosphoesterase family protein [Anaerolineae bacterium]|jgi:predicted phosphodiesterase|nr:metallophosphoesterase family protein [Anaerolineae bacterium]